MLPYNSPLPYQNINSVGRRALISFPFFFKPWQNKSRPLFWRIDTVPVVEINQSEICACHQSLENHHRALLSHSCCVWPRGVSMYEHNPSVLIPRLLHSVALNFRDLLWVPSTINTGQIVFSLHAAENMCVWCMGQSNRKKGRGGGIN